jgi:hypothetical protein
MYRLATLILVASVHGFAPAARPAHSFGVSSCSTLYSSAAQDFINRAREDAEAAPEEVVPKLFEDDLLDDMQQCLLLLEQRVKEGPGSLTHENVDAFARAAGRVLQDMHQQGNDLEQRVQPGERQARAEAVAAAAAVAAEKEGKAAKDIEAVAKQAFDDAMLAMIPPPPDAEPLPAVTPPKAAASVKDPVAPASTDPEIDSHGHIVGAGAPKVLTNKVEIDPDLEEDGPAYDGQGGMGLAKGTANTYTIEGMEEMTPDEYQAALTQSVIDRANDRRAGMGGRHGNQQTNDYMQSLATGGDVNPFAKGTQEGNEGMM